MGDDEVQSHETNGTRHFDMDEAFCARMRMAIAAGLENAPIGVITTPGTKNPRYLATELSLPKTLSKLTIGPRRNQNIIAA
jgi:hypothetical protein